jgi:hypothetical protein
MLGYAAQQEFFRRELRLVCDADFVPIEIDGERTA